MNFKAKKYVAAVSHPHSDTAVVAVSHPHSDTAVVAVSHPSVTLQ